MEEKDLEKALSIIKSEMKRIAFEGYKEVDRYNTLEWTLSVFNECDSSIN